MRKLIDNDFLTMFSRIFIGIILIYASYYKILDPGAFAKSIWYYHMVPGVLINLMALVLAWLELVVGIALIVGWQYRGAVVWSNILMVFFMIAMTTAISRGISIDCGCFKAAQASNNSALHALLWDLLYFVFTLQLLFSKSKRWLLQK